MTSIWVIQRSLGRSWLIAFLEVRCSLHGLRCLRIDFFAIFFIPLKQGLNGSIGEIGAGVFHGSKEFRNAKGCCTSCKLQRKSKRQATKVFIDFHMMYMAHTPLTECFCRISMPLRIGVGKALGKITGMPGMPSGVGKSLCPENWGQKYRCFQK